MDKFSRLSADIFTNYPTTEVLKNEPMKSHTTFRIGGPVRLMVMPDTDEAAAFAIKKCREYGLPMMVVGNGSDLLVSDDEHELVVIKSEQLFTLEAEGDTLCCGAGVTLSKIASFALKLGLTGFEFAHGIPGTLGGGVYMNAGAYGGEIKDVIESVTYISPDSEVRTCNNAECEFAYRHSRFDDGSMILSARIKLSPGNPLKIREKMNELSEKRRDKQPLNYPSAGSTFKRPVGGFAAALIDEAGLKGYRVGGAEVSEKHAGFVINRDNATFDDVIAVIDHVRDTVYKTSGIMLEPEVKIIR